MRRVRLDEARCASRRPNCFRRATPPRATGSSSDTRSTGTGSAFMRSRDSGCAPRRQASLTGEPTPRASRSYQTFAPIKLRAHQACANAPEESVPERSGFLEAVADAVEGLDHLEALVGHLELLAQALDVAVDRPVVHIDLVVIGRVHKGIAALHHAGARRQRLEDQELGHGQGDGLALPGAGMALRVHLELAALQRLGVDLARGGLIFRGEAPQHGLDALD